MTRRPATLALAAAMTLSLAACGSGGDSAEVAAEPRQEQTAPQADETAANASADIDKGADSTVDTSVATDLPAVKSSADTPGHSADVDHSVHASSAFPDVEVVRVTKGGEKVNLQSLHTPGKATLLWFWAPHCPFCKAEAPKLLEFNKKHGDKVTVLGLGAQDDLDQAEGFCNETKTNPLEMVWDASGKSWVHYKVTNQPTVIVIDKDGKVVKKWFREFDEQGILKAAGEA